MVELVYFGEELCQRAPGIVGSLYHGSSKQWVSALEAVEAVKAKFPIVIRPATESEMRRAEALVAMHDIGRQIGEKLNQLLDQETPEEVQKAKDVLRTHLAAIDTPPQLLDKV